MSSVSLKHGSRSVMIDVDGFDLLGVLEPTSVPTSDAEAVAAVDDALGSPIGSPALEELALGAKTAAIFVSGKDRVTRADVFMPRLIDVLVRAGLERSDISVFMATGTHVAFRQQDRPLVLGPSFPDDIRVIGHDCTDRDAQVELGTTSFGNRVLVNRAAYEHDVKVLTGRITHHYFAGFTAGRKAVLPGVSALETIQFNHRLVLSGPPEHPRHPDVGNGSIERNPVHLDMLEGARMFEPTFIVNTVIGADHQVSRVVAGDLAQAHAAGCATVAETFEVAIDRRAELAIGSCGGAPYDCSFMQALKTLMNTSACVADGGAFLLLAECPEGIKPDFLRWEHGPSLTEFAQQVVSDYDLTGHNTYLLREILERIDVILVSDCPQGEVERLGLVATRTLEEGLRAATERLGTQAPTTYLIPYGNITVVSAG